MDGKLKETIRLNLGHWLTQCKSKSEFLELCWETFLLDEEGLTIIWEPQKQRVVRWEFNNHLILIYPLEQPTKTLAPLVG
jgi:hypothetical protein